MLDWFSDVLAQVTSTIDERRVERRADPELLNLLRASLREHEILYDSAAIIGKAHVPTLSRSRFKSKMLELQKGLLIKVFIEIGSSDRRWSREEIEMSTVLFEFLWGNRTSMVQAKKNIEKITLQARSLSWNDLVKPFRQISALHDNRAELENLTLRIAGLIARANGVVCLEETRCMENIQQELRSALYRKEGENSKQQRLVPAVDVEEKSNGKQEQDEQESVDKDQMLADAQEELATLVGLEEVKNEIRLLIDFLKIQVARESHGIPRTDISLHMVFCGNPGTGKTTVARIIGHILCGLNFLEKGHTIETDRSGLVAGYAGRTGTKTNERIDEAKDGVLFIDEAYSLSSENTEDVYGEEAVQVLLKRMEDERNSLVVILAGYPKPMKSMIRSNPGLSSRFQRTFVFPDYNAESMLEIFNLMCQKHHYRYTRKAKEKLLAHFHQAWLDRDEHFGNGRFVRNVFEKSIRHMSSRLVLVTPPLTKKLLTTIVDEDIRYKSSKHSEKAT
ncbi:MAG: AAA family ATPase [Blastopirellula sp.]|nr:MAG: AAA family ATPase [Blastopirellula sp.]